MRARDDVALAGAVRERALPLAGAHDDWSPLLERVGDAQFVLLGEASHGTHDFYRARAEITKRLVSEKGFTAVAVEADWPDAYRVNRFVRGIGPEGEAVDALAGFERFPTWMWRNADVLDFVGWLRAWNETASGAACGFYGIDLYSLHRSVDAVVEYLRRIDPVAAQVARDRYACFDRYVGEPAGYGFAAQRGIIESCEEDVVRQLRELRERSAEALARDGAAAEDEAFYAEQNARVVIGAEQYYRTMYRGGVSSWNLRDRHMVETLASLVGHLGRGGATPKVVVWAHNSHLGDARATQFGDEGELNVGQLVRERWGAAKALLVGFTTYDGTVTAADDWGDEPSRMRVREALPGSYEALLHLVGLPRFFLDLAELGEAAGDLAERRLERAIGVVYRPRTERLSHYFDAKLPAQFDCVFHYDRTRAVEPLERAALWDRQEPPETFPSAL